MHYGESDVAPYQVSDSNRLGEAYRMIAAVSAGGKPLLRVRLKPAHPRLSTFAVDGGQVWTLGSKFEKDMSISCQPSVSVRIRLRQAATAGVPEADAPARVSVRGRRRPGVCFHGSNLPLSVSRALSVGVRVLMQGRMGLRCSMSMGHHCQPRWWSMLTGG